MSKDKDVKKKKKKFKINFTKICVWFALLAMVGAAIMAILSPILYNTSN